MKQTSEQIEEALDAQLGLPVSLYCQVGVYISGAIMTLEPGHGPCQYDLVKSELRIGIGPHVVSETRLEPNGTLHIRIY